MCAKNVILKNEIKKGGFLREVSKAVFKRQNRKDGA